MSSFLILPIYKKKRKWSNCTNCIETTDNEQQQKSSLWRVTLAVSVFRILRYSAYNTHMMEIWTRLCMYKIYIYNKKETLNKLYNIVCNNSNTSSVGLAHLADILLCISLEMGSIEKYNKKVIFQSVAYLPPAWHTEYKVCMYIFSLARTLFYNLFCNI